MIKVVTLNPNSDNYILNSNNERCYHLTEADRIVFKNVNGASVIISKEDLRQQFCGLKFVERDDITYLFDDGYYNKLITSGYIVMNNCDSIKLSKDVGEKVIISLVSELERGFENLPMIPDSIVVTEDPETYPIIEVKYHDEYYDFTFRLRSTTSLSEANQIRKINNLPFYPFDSRMDKYGTYYLAAYAKLKDDLNSDSVYVGNYPEKYIIDVLHELLKVINQNNTDIYHYETMKLKRFLVYSGRDDM